MVELLVSTRAYLSCLFEINSSDKMLSVKMFMLLVMLSTILCQKRKPKSRGLNAKIDQLQSVFQKELFALKLDLHDLRTELLLEQEKTARLEELLNETRSAAPDCDDFVSKGNAFPSTMHEASKLQTAVEILQVAFKEEKVELAKIRTDVRATKVSIKANKDDLEHIVERVQSLSHTVDNTSTEIKASVQENTERIQDIGDKLREHETNGSHSDMPSSSVGDPIFFDYADFTIVKESTTTATTTPDNYAKCLAAIRAGGPSAADILYIGVTVKRGQDWKWGDQDGAGQGQIVKLPDDLGSNWLRVQWGDSYQNNYRMGVGGKYDLDIEEDKYDFSKCSFM